MKKTALLISVVATSLLFSTITIIAAEQCPVSFGEYEKLMKSNIKNQCLIVARNCADDVSTVQQRVDDLRVEIAKGSEVYTPHELMQLKEQMKWIEADSDNKFI